MRKQEQKQQRKREKKGREQKEKENRGGKKTGRKKNGKKEEEKEKSEKEKNERNRKEREKELNRMDNLQAQKTTSHPPKFLGNCLYRRCRGQHQKVIVFQCAKCLLTFCSPSHHRKSQTLCHPLPPPPPPTSPIPNLPSLLSLQFPLPPSLPNSLPPSLPNSLPPSPPPLPISPCILILILISIPLAPLPLHVTTLNAMVKQKLVPTSPVTTAKCIIVQHNATTAQKTIPSPLFLLPHLTPHLTHLSTLLPTPPLTPLSLPLPNNFPIALLLMAHLLFNKLLPPSPLSLNSLKMAPLKIQS